MSRWHREHPELAGTDADPWMANESYRRLVPAPESEREADREERERERAHGEAGDGSQ